MLSPYWSRPQSSGHLSPFPLGFVLSLALQLTSSQFLRKLGRLAPAVRQHFAVETVPVSCLLLENSAVAVVVVVESAVAFVVAVAVVVVVVVAE